MQRSLIPIEIQAIERCMLDNPLCDFKHTFIGHNKIDRGAKPLTDGLPTCVELTTCVLIKCRGNATGNMFGKLA